MIDELLQEAEMQVPDDGKLARLSTLANEMLQLQGEIEKLNALIEERQERVDALALKEIPELMSSIGVESFKLTDKSEINVNPFYSANIKEENRAAAHEWLRTNNFGELIKNEFKIALGKGDDETAASLEVTLEQMGLGFERKEGVNPQTLKAFVKEQHEKGAALPDVLGVFIGRVAKIVKPKIKKEKGKK